MISFLLYANIFANIDKFDEFRLQQRNWDQTELTQQIDEWETAFNNERFVNNYKLQRSPGCNGKPEHKIF